MTKPRQISVPVSAPTSVIAPAKRRANPSPRTRTANAPRRSDSLMMEHPEAFMAAAVGVSTGVLTGLITKEPGRAAVGATIGAVAGGLTGHQLRKKWERRENPSTGGVLLGLAVIGVGSYTAWRLIHEGGKNLPLPPGNDPDVPGPTDPLIPVEPSVSDSPIGSVIVSRQLGALNLQMSKGPVSKGMMSVDIDNNADSATATPSSYPFDMLISLANGVDSDGTVSYDGDVEIVDGQPGGRDILVRFYAPATFNFRAGARDEYAPGYSQSTNEPFEIVAI